MKTVEEIKEIIRQIEEVEPYYAGADIERKDTEDYEKLFKKVIVRRLEHCAEQLEKNAHKAKTPMSLIVFWEDGHFSLPVYEELTKAINDQTIREWSTLTWEQILRQLFDEGNRDKNLFYYASEMLLMNPALAALNRKE